jgi:hypothetical protein
MCPTALGRKEKKLSNVHIVHCTQNTPQCTQTTPQCTELFLLDFIIRFYEKYTFYFDKCFMSHCMHVGEVVTEFQIDTR